MTNKKIEAKEMLLKLKGYLEEESKRLVKIVDWLSKSEQALPRLSELKNAVRLKLIIRKGIFSATPERLKYIATVATIISAIIGVISLMQLLVYP